MKRRNYARIGAACMAMMLTLQSAGNMWHVKAAGDVHPDSQTQMSSEPETVYVNYYQDAANRTQNFDSNWRFYLGDAGDAHVPAFDDSKWRNISLPHDYSIEQEYSQSMEAESGYLPGGTGWYRKNFTVGSGLSGKRLQIDFDGVYMNSTVWVNGTKLGTHPYGYTPFSYDITDYVKFGEENTIAVKVDHRTPSSRWYSGSGIYRSVNLTITDQVHVDQYGTKIETNDLAAEAGGPVSMNIKTTVANDTQEAKTVTVTNTVFKKGADVSEKIGEGSKEIEVGQGAEAEAVVDLTTTAAPQLWSVDDPALYTVRTEVKAQDQVLDTYDTDYGFRYFTFDNNTGFSLNGEKMKLKGVCMHHDQGSLGAVANRRAVERQVEILKEMGCNSIRVTHNPASQALIDVCNEKGMLVVDEIFDGWMYAKNGNTNDYASWFRKEIEEGNTILGAGEGMTWAEYDLKATLKRGQNAPSIIMWSLGNEIQEGAGGSGYNTMAQSLIAWAQEVDTTRLLTIGSNAVKNNNAEHVNIANQLTAVGGVSGTNYSGGSSYDDLHTRYPDWNLYGSETASSVNSRGVYFHKGTGGMHSSKQLTSYDKSKVGWGALASQAWYDVIKRDFVAGEYVWTGFDYIGEPTPWNKTDPGAKGDWPSPKNSYFGIIDTAGFPKDSYYFYQSQWNDKVNTLHVLPTWNEDGLVKSADGKVEVVVYSDAASVELFLNDKSLGKQSFETITTGEGYTYKKLSGSGDSHQNLYMTWQVAYEEGTLRAVAYDESGNVIKETQGRTSVTTTGQAESLSASVDRSEINADGADLSYITVDVKDQDGNIVPDAENRVTFKVEGAGKLVGVDNGSAPDHDSYKLDNRKAFSGKVLGIVQSEKQSGEIKVTVSADGLIEDTVVISAKGQEGTGKKDIDNFRMIKSYYVKKGNMPKLPETIETHFTDGSTENLPVTWETITDEQIQTAGSFTVRGRLESGHEVTVYINMIDDIGGLLNYSTTIPVGTEPILPESRQAVMPDGTILSASFPVTWSVPDDADYSKEGIVEIPGKANVLGKEISVTASVRVQTEKITIGDSVSGAGILSQDIPEELQSDTLDAIKDGNTAISDNMGGGANPTAWSNWKNSQTAAHGGVEDDTAEITFRYDTQQRIGQIVIYFAKDSGSMRYPDAGTTKIQISDDGQNWTDLENEETIGTENGRVKPYTYNFDPTVATYVKFCLTNSTAATGSQFRACTAITEIELKEAKGEFVINKTAALEKLMVNGVEAPAGSLASGSYATPALVADVEAKGADNAAVTILPVYDNKVKLIIESEDHNTRNVFEIRLGEEVLLPPSDDSRDYPKEKLTATAGSTETGRNLNPSNVLDGNEATHWHSVWNTGGKELPLKDRWLMLELEEPAVLEAFRYLPKTGSGGDKNGTVTKYLVEVSMDGTGWDTVSEGEWDIADGWKTAQFTEPAEAKYVRLTGVETWGDGSQKNFFMSGLEMRVRKVKDTIDISDPASGITVEVPAEVVVPEADENNPVQPEVIVKKGEEVLRWGIDYKTEYKDNTAFGTGKVIVTGMIDYSGTVVKEFTIKEVPVTITGLSVKTAPEKTTYQEGETFDPKGLAVEVTYSDNTKKETAYSEATADQFAFEPGLDKKLKESDKTVKVTYAGQEAVINITVEKIPVTVTGLSIKTAPAKTKYQEGETFDPKGLVVEVTYSDNTKKETAYSEATADQFAFEPGLDKKLKESDKTVKVTYAGQEAVINITVEKIPVTVTGLSIKTAPAKTKYQEGETFDPKGLVVEVTYSDNTKKETAYSEATADQFAFEPGLDKELKESDKTVKVTYEGQETVIEIAVEKIPVNPTEPADKTALQEAIGKAKAVKTDKYTDTTVEAMNNALKAAEDLMKDDSLTEDDQEKVDAAAEALNDSIGKLETKKVEDIFKDISADSWYRDYVQYVFDRDIMNGMKKDEFGPDVVLTRSHFATMLYRMEGEPDVMYTDRFKDVPDEEFYTNAVMWASDEEVGVINGYLDGNFGPNDNITREQMAVMLYRYAEYKGYDVKVTDDLTRFEDGAKVSEFAQDAMQWAVGAELIKGEGEGNKLNPQGATSRAVCATIMQRFIEKNEK